MTNDSSDGSVPIIQGVGGDSRSLGMSATEKLRALAARIRVHGIAVAPGDADAINELMDLVEEVTRPIESSSSPPADLIGDIVHAWLSTPPGLRPHLDVSRHEPAARRVLSALAARGVGESLPTYTAIATTICRFDDSSDSGASAILAAKAILEQCVVRLAPVLAAKDERIRKAEVERDAALARVAELERELEPSSRRG